MKLKISNFAKLNQADILIDGITVIAGENNTGKSTIGKILFSLFNAISDIDEKIVRQRKKEIEDSCRLIIRDYSMHSNPRSIAIRNATVGSRRIAYNIIKELEHEELNIDIIRTIIIEALSNLIFTLDKETEDIDEMIDVMIEKIVSIINLSEDAITLEVLTRYFRNVFNKQINSLTKGKSKAELTLEIKGKGIKLLFENNECAKFESSISLMHKAIYVDNPFIVDKLTGYGDLNTMDDFLRELLLDESDNDIMDGIIESVLTKEKLEEIYQTLQCVVDGNIIEKQYNEYYLVKKGFNEPISFSNLSTGLKAFVLLKMLLEKGILKEKDVLVLDEPEIHLHPQWQISYAELIVLLQKHFDLSIIVATHSPYFLDAINLFSVKYGIDKKVNYYLSSMINNKAEMELVTDSIDKIYKKMATPVQLLDTLRYELNNK